MPARKKKPYATVASRFFPNFLEIFLPVAYAEIDWERGFESLDKDMKKLLPKSKSKGRWADKMMKVWCLPKPVEPEPQELGKKKKKKKVFVASEPNVVHLHAEFQNQPDEELPERMYITSYRAFDLYHCPIASLVIVGQKGDWSPESDFGWQIWDTRSELEFPIVRLWEYNQPEHWAKLEAMAERNPAAVLIMAHVKAMATQNKASSRYSWKLNLFRRLLESRYTRQDIEDLLHYVDWLMQLPEPLENKLDEEIEMEATERVPYTTPWERRGRKEGRKEGLEEGLEKGLKKGREEGLTKGLRLGKAQTLKDMATRRFGELETDASLRIDRADVDTLDRWIQRLLDAKNLDDIFADDDDG